VDVARPQRAPLQIAELVECEQRMIAGAGEMAIIGTALLGAVRLADAAVHVEHDGGLRPARMHPVDPGAGQIGQRREIGLAGQPPGLEAGHLAGRGRCAVKTLPAHHGAHRGIVGETFGVVDVPRVRLRRPEGRLS
jgi:hypothetical protein